MSEPDTASEIRPYVNLGPRQAYALEQACTMLMHAALWMEREADGGRQKAADCRLYAEELAKAFYSEIRDAEADETDPMDALQKANQQARKR